MIAFRRSRKFPSSPLPRSLKDKPARQTSARRDGWAV